MASKKRGGHDDFNWDDDLNFDIPDPGSDSPEAYRNDRSPIVTGAKSAAAGFGKTFANEARLRKTLTKSLPKEYEEPISKAFELRDGVRDLYNNATTQTQEYIRETKRSVNRIARNLEGSIPKSLSDKIIRATEAKEGSGYNEPSKEEIENNTINQALGDLFPQLQKAEEDKEKKRNAREILTERVEQKRHSDMVAILGSVDQSLIQMTTFQTNITTNYMKKSMELQFRSYFVLNDMLQLQTKSFMEFKNELASITKNTGLPDFVKKAPKEALIEHFREKTFDSISNTIASRRNKWLSSVTKRAGEKVGGLISKAREGTSMLLDTAESMSSMAESGMGPSKEEMIGDIAGSTIGNKVQDAIAKRLRAVATKNPKVLRMGNRLNQISNNLPQWVNDQVENGKYADRIPDWLKEILALDGEPTSVRMNREVDLERAKQWSDKNSQSLNIVIPELLAKIHQELYVGRTGDTSAGAITYDYTAGKFVTKKERRERLLGSLVSDDTVKRTREGVDEIFQTIDPNGSLDKAARDQIAESIYRSNKQGTYFNHLNMQSYSSLGTGVGSDRASELINAYITGDPSGARERKLGTMFGKVGADNGNIRDYVQALVDSGRHSELQELGLLDEKGRIDTDALRRMELGIGSELPNADPALTASAASDPSSPTGKKRWFDSWFKGGNPETQRGPTGSVGGGDFNEAVKLLKETTEALSEVRDSGRMGERSFVVLEKAIAEASGKNELVEIRDILKRIEENGMSGGGGIMSPEMLEKYFENRNGGFFGKFGKKVAGGVGSFAKFMKNGVMGSSRATMDLGKKAIGWATSGSSNALGWLSKQKDKFDLFVEGEIEPRLNKRKMQMGRYVDVVTGKVIEKFEDIKGDIKDLDTGEVVLRATEIKDAILKNVETGKAKLARLTDWGKSAIGTARDAIQKSAQRFMGIGKSISSFGFKTLKAAYDNFTDGPQDVYLKDSYDTPVLLKRIMSKGLYFDQETLDAIYKVSDIKGAVVDNQENVLITLDDLHNGLYDKNGREIKTGVSKIAQMVGDSFKKSMNTYKKVLGSIKGAGSKAMGWVKSLFGYDSAFTVFSKHTNDILTAIYNLLNDRMPGERSPELSQAVESSSSGRKTIGQRIKGLFTRGKDAAANAAGAVRDRAGNLIKVDSLNGLDYDYIKKAHGQVSDKMGRAKDTAVAKLDELVELFRERMPEPKKAVFGDLSGDGIRDGSIDDIRQKRKEKADEDKATMGAAAFGASQGAKSIYGRLADALKAFQQRSEEDSDDGDTYIYGGGGDGDGKKGKKGKGKGGKNAKPRGRLGRGWDWLKNKITPKGNSRAARWTRGLGRGIGAVGRFGGRMLGGAGRLAGGLLGLTGLGGVASAASGAIGLLGSAASAIGTGLGIIGTGLGAILSSPVTLPIMAAAAVAGGTYLAYKWLTKPDPKALERVRMVQYGWKPDNLDAYKKIKMLETTAQSMINYSQDGVTFSEQKFDQVALMKAMDLNPENPQLNQKFNAWFAHRFRPVFLSYAGLFKTLNISKAITDADDLDEAQKKTILENASFPGEHYAITTSPFADEAYLSTSEFSVKNQIAGELDQFAKDKVKKEIGPVSDVGVGDVAAAAAAKQVADAKKIEEEQAKMSASIVGVPSPTEAADIKYKSPAVQRLEAATLGAAVGPGGGDPANPVSSPANPDGSPGTPGASSGGNAPSRSRAVPKPTTEQGKRVKATLIRDMPKFGINTPNQQAAFLGNIEHESNFMPVAENLNYKAATMVKLWPNRFKTLADAQAVASRGPQGIANNIYGNRMGNTEPNDGWDYRGRGPIQITGKDNYSRIAKIIGKDIVSDPDSVLTDPQTAAETAMAYWKMNPRLGRMADEGNFVGVRRAINGGKIGEADALSRVSNYLNLIRNNQLDVDTSILSNPAAPPEPASPGATPDASASGTPTPAPAGGATPSTDLSSNPNAGPVPAAYQAPSTPASSEPTPAFDPAAPASAAPMASVPTQSSYYQNNSSINTGDVVGILTKTAEEQGKHTSLLERIATSLENLPEALAGIISNAQGQQVEPPPATEQNNYGKPAQNMRSASNAFRRPMAGT